MRRLLAVLAATHALDMKQAPRRMLRNALGNTAAALGAASLVLHPLPSLAAKPSNAASSAGSRVNKDPQSLLRNGLPIDGQIGSATKKMDVRQLQSQQPPVHTGKDQPQGHTKARGEQAAHE